MMIDPNNVLPLALLSVAAIATIHLLSACYRTRPDTQAEAAEAETDRYWDEIDAELAELDRITDEMRGAAQ